MTTAPSNPAQRDAEHAEVALAAAGDRRAFERLYRTHADRVYTLCARMVNDREIGRASCRERVSFLV